ncbi:type II toxin-antitoxin system RelE/ParE family toxin [Burkholderia sp. LS-044]|uniref:type II toxin-antitoxin system RelE family toxin n=1 Tax=Burkholderia TaxID=32008 RepID=UPI0010A60CA3|nr:type II toxin-antitoxin system RelE/ParE family toxin [Burkholderia sp. LS-044]THJ52625.1 type II toxin-antitoxin system RelE/ParE family toxin [Burkholderia sp. LS-044]
MNLKPTKQALKAISKLDAKQYRQVVSAILALLSNPEPHDSQKLRGAPRGERRLDVGEYRVIYSFDDNSVEVLVVGKRNDGDVYSAWERSK